MVGTKKANKGGKHGGEQRGATRAGNKGGKQGMQLGRETRDGSNDVIKRGEKNKEGSKGRKQWRGTSAACTNTMLRALKLYHTVSHKGRTQKEFIT